MHTAKAARKLGRELWAVPGRINEEVAGGTNLLIQEGAKPLVSIDEFVSKTAGKRGQLSLSFDEPREAQQAPSLTDEAKSILSLLQRQGGKTVDSLISESGLEEFIVNSALIELEAESLITTEGGRYSATA